MVAGADRPTTRGEILMRTLTLLAAALALAAGPVARAATIDASSTTLFYAGQQAQGAPPGQTPDLATVAPLFEILTISARDLSQSKKVQLEIQFSGWGSWDTADLRWDNGTQGSVTGDVLTGFVKAQFLDRAVTLRLGRETVALGSTRYLQIDGGDVVLRLPAGFTLSGYVGSPVSQRFQRRTWNSSYESVSWNPAGGDLAYGGRLGWSLAPAGTPGKGLDIGAFYSEVTNSGTIARQDVGADLRLQPFSSNLSLAGWAVYSLVGEELSEATAIVTWTATRKLHVNLDWRFSVPSLVLPQTSILSVFSASNRNDIGGALTYQLTPALELGGDLHALLEPGATEGTTHTGWEAAARGRWSWHETALGIEGFYLDALENGYWGGRIYGRQDFAKRFFAALDVMGTWYREQVNGQDYAIQGTLSAGAELGHAWSAVVAGTAGVNPWFEQQYSVMAKLVYNQSYTTRQVR
jgi:hypothetical protein